MEEMTRDRYDDHLKRCAYLEGATLEIQRMAQEIVNHARNIFVSEHIGKKTLSEKEVDKAMEELSRRVSALNKKHTVLFPEKALL